MKWFRTEGGREGGREKGNRKGGRVRGREGEREGGRERERVREGGGEGGRYMYLPCLSLRSMDFSASKDALFPRSNLFARSFL